MQFLDKLFGRPDREETQLALIGPMKEMADKAERVHRNLVGIYAREYERTGVTGRGLYKARLHAAVIPVWAYLQLTGDEEGGMDLLNTASGVALDPLVEYEGPAAFSREEAKEEAIDFLKRSLSAVTKCMREGPSLPGDEKPGFEELASLVHESLRDSLGESRYSEPVRERFDLLIKSCLTVELKHAAELAGQDRRFQ